MCLCSIVVISILLEESMNVRLIGITDEIGESVDVFVGVVCKDKHNVVVHRDRCGIESVSGHDVKVHGIRMLDSDGVVKYVSKPVG